MGASRAVVFSPAVSEELRDNRWCVSTCWKSSLSNLHPPNRCVRPPRSPAQGALSSWHQPRAALADGVQPWRVARTGLQGRP
eukprot:CAMPEP_0194517310 /NCGR_PEP_ID=MMETSP0253-20130528/50434_1 /TAXON_ID=2966 /ORGANISM="Noctiluca scintillans" /LENGTH=81 /DNA_ID=CAMNT_0039361249 /DNA_START=502 /DNA_END=747 /DNA_ORIENTATION=+